MAAPQSDGHQGHGLMLRSRIRVLLGLPPQQPDSLAAALNEHDLDLDIGHERALGCVSVFTEPYEETWPTRPIETGPLAAEQVDQLFREIDFLQERALSGPMLRNGVSLKNYRLVQHPDREQYTLLLRSDEDLLVIGEYDTIGEAGLWANRTRRYLADLSLRSEGLHIVEHLMLRPAGEFEDARVVDSAFYSMRVSVVLPSWTARFSDHRFQSAAEELIQQNLPAHIAPSFIWLDHLHMGRFEAMLQAWQQARGESTGIDYGYIANPDASEDLVDVQADELADFLRHNARKPVASPAEVPR